MNILLIDNHIKQDCCPLCRGSNISPIGSLEYSEKINFSTHDIELSRTPEMWKCQECLSCFMQYTVDAGTAKILYSSGQACDRWSREAFDQNKTCEVIKHMAEIFKGKGSVLDVGCNTGELLDFAQKFGCNTSGVEYSSVSRRMLIDKGHAAYASLEEAPGEYDVIMAFDLVEHLYDVSAFLKSCHEKLSATGRLIILTGNINSLSARLSGSRWWYARYPEHIVFPSKKYFRENSGYRIEKWIYTYASKNYKSPIKMVLSEMLKVLLRRQTHTGLPSIGPDHVLIILRK